MLGATIFFAILGGLLVATIAALVILGQRRKREENKALGTTSVDRTPAQKYRESVHYVSPFYEAPLGSTSEEQLAFRTALEEVYTAGKADLEAALADEDKEAAMILSHRTVLLTTGVGLLAFGRLDVVGDILNGIPVAPRKSRALGAGSLKALLPMPGILSPYDNPDEVSRWVKANESRLRWSEDSGKFLLGRD
jgi:hypothetical protein